MTADSSSRRWQQAKALFDELAELPRHEQDERLTALAGNDPELAAELAQLLGEDLAPHNLVKGSALDHVEALLEDPWLDRQIGAYRVLRLLGSGGMGSVYLAARSDGQFEQQVALKVVKLGMSSTDILARFHSERRILAQLQHPNIARLLDGGLTETGQPYFTLEYVDGEPITTYCDRRLLPLAERLRLFCTVCEAVQYAHQNLVVHRDIKPGNVMITRDGTVKLLDFGIAKVLTESDLPGSDPHLTRTGMRVLTPAYAAPEQAAGAVVTTAADVYSLGILLYEILTGTRPSRSQTEPSVLRNLSEGDPAERPSQAVARLHRTISDDVSAEEIVSNRGTDRRSLERHLRGDLDNICLMALRPDPLRRYSSAGQLGEDIERFLERRPVKARPDTMGYRLSRFVRRNWLGVATGLAALVTVAAIVTFYTIRLADERDRARTEALKATQVADFLTDLFRAADPNQTRGAELTARELLDAGAGRIDDELGDQPEVQASLLNVIGRTYHQLGLFDEAMAMYDRAESVATSALGEQHPLVAEILLMRGIAYHDLGDLEQAEAHYRRALAINRAVYGDSHPVLVENLTDLGAVLKNRDRIDESIEVLQQSLDLMRRLPEIDSANLAHALNHLGRELTRLERYEEAIPMLREGLDIRRRTFGDIHVETIASRGALAAALRDNGMLDSAAALLRTGLAGLHQLYGEDHHYMGAMSNSLGNVEYELGNHETADSLFRRSLRILTAMLPADHLELSSPMAGIGHGFLDSGQLDSAEIYFRSGYDICRAAVGEDHRRTAQLEYWLGRCLTAQGRFSEAQLLLEHSFATLRGVYGDGHKQVERVRSALGELHQARGDSTAVDSPAAIHK